MVVDLGAKEAEYMIATNKDLTRAQRRRGITVGLLRALGISAVLIALYYLAPLDQRAGISLLLSLIIGLLVLAVMTAYHVWAILRAAHPGVRAVEALATTVLLFLLLFAATYFLMSHTSSSYFNVHALTRTDSIYFTVTVFSTVGFGDISPASQVARLVVTAQMIFNLIVLGLGVRLIVGAVQQARQTTRTAETGN
jgi:voltage-gated potassium channel